MSIALDLWWIKIDLPKKQNKKHKKKQPLAHGYPFSQFSTTVS
jgi:hypothetical protein